MFFPANPSGQQFKNRKSHEDIGLVANPQNLKIKDGKIYKNRLDE
jgi:hypothetical protein